MTGNTSDTLALAKRFFDAIEQGDIAQVRDIYAPNAIIWHNNDGLASTREDNLKVLENFIRHVGDRRYVERRVSAFDGGFVQQHLLKGRLKSGKEIALACCIVCEVRGGRITRLDEYFDSAALAAWRE